MDNIKLSSTTKRKEMSKLINLIKTLLNKNEEIEEATPYQFEYDKPVEGFDEFHNNLKTWRQN